MSFDSSFDSLLSIEAFDFVDYLIGVVPDSAAPILLEDFFSGDESAVKTALIEILPLSLPSNSS